MTDTIGVKATDSSMEKLCEIFSKIFEQQQQLKIPSDVLKCTIEPNPLKLCGPESYISWARHARLILNSHGYGNLLATNDEEVIVGFYPAAHREVYLRW
jgi:hypothetical protein